MASCKTNLKSSCFLSAHLNMLLVIIRDSTKSSINNRHTREQLRPHLYILLPVQQSLMPLYSLLFFIIMRAMLQATRLQAASSLVEDLKVSQTSHAPSRHHASGADADAAVLEELQTASNLLVSCSDLTVSPLDNLCLEDFESFAEWCCAGWEI